MSTYSFWEGVVRNILNKCCDAPLNSHFDHIVDVGSGVDEPESFVHQIDDVPETKRHIIVLIAVLILSEKELPEFEGDLFEDNKAINNSYWEVQNDIVDQEHVEDNIHNIISFIRFFVLQI